MMVMMREASALRAVRFARSGAFAAAVAFAAPPVEAQEVESAAAEASEENTRDIIVTARLREESLIGTPVAISVVGQAEIERRNIVTLDNLARSVPQMMISDAGVTAQGGIVVIRGTGVGESNSFADQAVSFNVDGVQLARSNIRRMAEVDMSQVEVLKGPQALFFGKNSPGGIIVIRSADPTSTFQAGLKGSYEFVGDEARLEGYVSGPLNESVGARLAVYGSRLKGYFRNVATPSPIYGPDRKRLPYNRDFGGRLTLKYDNGGPFDARFKISYGDVHSSGSDSNIQVVGCAFAAAQLSPGINRCSPGKTLVRPDPGPAYGAFDPDAAAEPYLDLKQTLASLEMNYAIGDALRLTSVTAFYDADQSQTAIFTVADSTLPNRIGVSAQAWGAREISEELRLQSDFEGRFNFLTGAYYQHAKLRNVNATIANALAPFDLVPKNPLRQRGDAYSAFGQGMFDITQTLELAAGVRYSFEKKHFKAFNRAGTAEIATPRPSASWKDWSPEVTLSWRPTQDFTLYGAFKEGFLSGGYNGSPGDVTTDRSYNPQRVKGFEAGAKGQTSDRRLRGSLTAYSYKTDGLQVNANIQLPNGSTRVVFVNAGKSKSQGVELEATFNPVQRLSLNGAIAYNRSRYQVFLAPCYAGQSIAQGCNALPSSTGVFTSQDLAGKRVLRAPDWSIQGGFNYAVPVSSAHDVAFFSDVAYSSGFFAQSTNKPNSWQSGYALLDGGIALEASDKSYRIALLGRNLTNKYVFFRTTDVTFTGSGAGTAAATPSDTLGSVNRGREVTVQFSTKF